MTKRVLDLLPAELASLSAKELLQAVAGSEGRVLAAETIGITPPLLSDVTNAEFAASTLWACPRPAPRTRCAG